MDTLRIERESEERKRNAEYFMKRDRCKTREKREQRGIGKQDKKERGEKRGRGERNRERRKEVRERQREGGGREEERKKKERRQWNRTLSKM